MSISEENIIFFLVTANICIQTLRSKGEHTCKPCKDNRSLFLVVLWLVASVRSTDMRQMLSESVHTVYSGAISVGGSERRRRMNNVFAVPVCLLCVSACICVYASI